MESKRVYGIDLGTTYSCIAYVDEGSGKPLVIPNREGDYTTPSVVLFEDDKTRVVGKEAKNAAVLEADQVVEMVKRQMGAGDWQWFFEGREYKPEEISSYILRKVVDDAADTLDEPPKDVVITCPAYFGIGQREATASAGKIAGLNVLEVINEPTAAAIAYGLQDERDQVVVVYDLGGGTFDVTVIEIKDGSITVVATGGDHELGGRDWDEELVKYLASEWKRETGSSDEPIESSATLQDLWQRAETAKRALSGRTETRVAVNHAAQPVGVQVTRERFDELTRPLLERTVEFTKETLATASAKGHPRVDQLLLVGGSSRMPQVAERLQAEFGLEPKLQDPDQLVAKGAAIYGQKLAIAQQLRSEIAKELQADPEEVNPDEVAPEVEENALRTVADTLGMRLPAVKKINDMQVTNVASHSFGIEVVDTSGPQHRSIISNLVTVQQQVPAELARTFYTLESNQAEVELRVMENAEESENAELETGQEIGKAALPLTPNLPEGSPIEVTFRLNQDGRLKIKGRDVSAGGGAVDFEIETAGVLSKVELEEAISHARGVKVTG